MDFFVNGQYQFTIHDPVLTSGGVGVFARSTNNMAVTVNFSDLVVYEVNPIDQLYHHQINLSICPNAALINKLNDLSPKEWLKFQKSWFVHNPPPRQKNVLRHPAKFPETLAMEFITFFTKTNAGGV